MTVTELRKFLEAMEKEGRGKCKICVVSSLNCDTIDDRYDKYTEDVKPYFDDLDNTITITD